MKFMYGDIYDINAGKFLTEDDLEREFMVNFDMNGCPLKVGDKVRLNNYGFDVLPRLSKDEMQEALGVLVVESVGPKLDPDSWSIDVVGKLNGLCFTTKCFDREV